MPTLGRRELLLGLGGLAPLACVARPQAGRAEAEPSPAPRSSTPASRAEPPSPPTQERDRMDTRSIPRTGEALACVGLGTWQTFDVGAGAAARAGVTEVLRRFFAAGGQLVDSSPMYGRAEAVVGELLAELDGAPDPPVFLATKVWTRGERAGREQIQRSIERMARGPASRIDLMQVHNLVDVETHLPVLRELRAAGTIRYLGVTHYQHGQFDRIEALMRSESLDFVQIPYSVVDRRAEQRILPAAADTGTAVLVMTPFESGELFSQVAGRPLPDWAAELDCASWAQLFLKFILGHPAVTCPLPATGKPDHLDDNVAAGRGRMPDEAERERIAAAVAE